MIADDYKNELAQESRRRFVRDFLAYTGWVFLGGAELVRSSSILIAGDGANGDKNFGGLKGRVLFDGSVPEAKEVDLSKANLAPAELEWFKSTGPILNQDWVIDPKTKAVSWVYVWLQPLDKKKPLIAHESLTVIPEDKKLIIVDQDPTGYVPHAVAIQEGQGLLMRNKGPVGHVFNFNGFENEPFNKAMPPGSEIAAPNFKAEKGALQVNCPPHPWERMFLRVFDHPYFAVTKPDGTFEFKMVPAGPCRLVVWHEILGFNGGRKGKDGSEIKVEGGAVSDLGDIKIKPTAT